MSLRVFFVVLVAFAASQLPFVQVADAVGSAGKLVIAGGAITSAEAELWKHMLQERLADRPIGIISTASDTPQKTSEATAKKMNERYGKGTAIAIPLSVGDESASDPMLIALIKECGGFYFTGGLQSRTMHAFYTSDAAPRPALSAVMELYRSGAVVGGSSAGAAIMSDPMILNGSSAKALVEGVTWESTPVEKRGVSLGRGLGFHPELLYCQHHIERGRFGRLLTALASEEFPQTIGLGVAEDSFILVDRQRNQGQVLGRRGALYIDASKAERTATGGLTKVLVHRLESRDTIDFSTGSVHPGERKIRVPFGVEEVPRILYEDAWAKDAIWDLLGDLAPLKKDAVGVALDENFRLSFTKTSRSETWQQPDRKPGAKSGWTLSNIELSLEPR